MYKLNTKSRAARFYSWLWKTEVSKFKTMCPYFWKYTLTIIFLPVILLGKLLYYLTPAKTKISEGFEYVSETKAGKVTGQAFGTVADKVFSPSKFWDVTGKILKWGWFSFMAIWLVIVLIMMGVGFYQNPVGGLAVVGAVAILIGVVIGIVISFTEYNLGSKIAYPFKLFGNMVYSLYKNVCPMIKWN